MDIEEAKEYVKNVETNGSKIANGVMAIIMTTAIIVLLEGLVQKEIISDTLRNILGISTLLLVVAVAVYFFITAGSNTEKFEYLEKEPFDLTKDAENFTENYRSDLSFYKKIARNVMAIILAVITIIVVSQINESDIYTLPAVAFLLLVVSIATRSFIYNGMRFETTEVLLQENEFNREAKKYSSVIDKIGNIYWPIMVLIYLASSFITKRWDITWIIWPVSGVIFAIISTIVTNVFSKDEK